MQMLMTQDRAARLSEKLKPGSQRGGASASSLPVSDSMRVPSRFASARCTSVTPRPYLSHMLPIV